MPTDREGYTVGYLFLAGSAACAISLAVVWGEASAQLRVSLAAGILAGIGFAAMWMVRRWRA